MKRKTATRTSKPSSLSSVLSTNGATARLYRITKRRPVDTVCNDITGCNINWVKDENPQNKSQSSYIKQLREKEYRCGQNTGSTDSNGSIQCMETYMIGTTLKTRSWVHKDVGSVTSGEYTKTRLISKNCLPPVVIE